MMVVFGAAGGCSGGADRFGGRGESAGSEEVGGGHGALSGAIEPAMIEAGAGVVPQDSVVDDLTQGIPMSCAQTNMRLATVAVHRHWAWGLARPQYRAISAPRFLSLPIACSTATRVRTRARPSGEWASRSRARRAWTSGSATTVLALALVQRSRSGQAPQSCGSQVWTKLALDRPTLREELPAGQRAA